MSDPVINTVVRWWFRLFVACSMSAFLGVVAFIEFGVRAGSMSQTAYIYAGVIGVLMVLVLIWVRGKVNQAPEMIEGFLRRMGLYKDKVP